MPTSASSPLVAHLLARLNADLDFLASQSILSRDDLVAIRARLPTSDVQSSPTSANNASGDAVLAASVASLNLGGLGGGASAADPPEGATVKATAVWDYPQTQPDDLGFSKGDIITILEEMSHDWWRGSLDGRTGIFPSNYVERLPDALPGPARTVPPIPSSSNSFNSGYNPGTYPAPQAPWSAPGGSYTAPNTYTPPPTPYGQAYAAPGQYQPYQAPSSQFEEKKEWNQGYQPPPPPQQQQQAPPFEDQQPQQQQQPGAPPVPKKKFGGKLGGMMAQSFAGGIGFGAGSAIASDAIHAIF